MANQISAKEYTLWELMKGEFVFNIPDYQRPYSWTKNEAVTLWDDLTEFWAENAANSERSYFIGSIVLVKKMIRLKQKLLTVSNVFLQYRLFFLFWQNIATILMQTSENVYGKKE